tara:strand:+ start:1026 stop:1298 length:273 start_codon:yes stop_codon:yes gene_type:complete
MVQVILLKNDVVLISEIEEVGADIGEPDCLLKNPYQILGKHETDAPPEDRFVKWMNEYTNSDKFMLRSDDVLTFMEPHEKLIEHYNKISK